MRGSISKYVISKRCRNRPLGPLAEGGPGGFFDGGNRRDEWLQKEPLGRGAKGRRPLGRRARIRPCPRKGGSERSSRWKGETRSGFPLQRDWLPQRAEGDSDTDIESHKPRCFRHVSSIRIVLPFLIKSSHMKTAIIFLVLFAGAMLAATSARGENMVDQKQAMVSLLPLEAGGWKAAPAEDQFFDPETIFDYIDGAGEVYRAYNFGLLLSRRYQREGQADLVADLFDMRSSLDAFGVFTHDLEGEEAGVGQGSNYKGGLLSFWRGRYFISLYAEKESEEAKQALLALGRAAALAIGGDGERPSLLALLPEDFRDLKGTHYFHTFPILNYHFFVSPDNILNLGPETEAVLAAQPGAAGASSKERLTIIRYPHEKDAGMAFISFCRASMPETAPAQDKGQEEQLGREQESRLFKTKDGLWTAAGVKRNMVVVVFQAPTSQEAIHILQRAIKGLDKP